jgi:hypothetical protein
VSSGIPSYVNNSKPIANSGPGGRKQYSFFILQLPQTLMKKTRHVDYNLFNMELVTRTHLGEQNPLNRGPNKYKNLNVVFTGV